MFRTITTILGGFRDVAQSFGDGASALSQEITDYRKERAKTRDDRMLLALKESQTELKLGIHDCNKRLNKIENLAEVDAELSELRKLL